MTIAPTVPPAAPAWHAALDRIANRRSLVVGFADLEPSPPTGLPAGHPDSRWLKTREGQLIAYVQPSTTSSVHGAVHVFALDGRGSHGASVTVGGKFLVDLLDVVLDAIVVKAGIRTPVV